MRARLLVVGFALGVAATAVAMPALRDSTPEAHAAGTLGRKSFHRALDTVLDRYVDPVDAPRLLARGLKHMVSGLDPHSHYLTARERRDIRKRARGGTTGLVVALRGGDGPAERWLEVISVAPGSPAHAAKIAAGDHILGIRGQDVAFLQSQVEADGLLVGRVGDTLALSVQRHNEPSPVPVALTLTRDRGKVVTGKLMRDAGAQVAHLHIRAFRKGTGERVKQVLASLRRAAGKTGVSGIVIDLRGNAGGEVDEALIVADLFVASGILTRTRGRGGKILREERAHAAGTDGTTPIVVLQDRHSASASELLAVALQEHGRAKVVGERSYGKGTVQEVIGMEDGSVLALTIARYFSPKDHVIDGIGVAPDRHVVLGRARKGKGDVGMAAALRELRGS